MTEVEAHISVTVTCLECGRSQDIEEYDYEDVPSAVNLHRDDECPRCTDEEVAS